MTRESVGRFRGLRGSHLLSVWATYLVSEHLSGQPVCPPAPLGRSWHCSARCPGRKSASLRKHATPERHTENGDEDSGEESDDDDTRVRAREGENSDGDRSEIESQRATEKAREQRNRTCNLYQNNRCDVSCVRAKEPSVSTECLNMQYFLFACILCASPASP